MSHITKGNVCLFIYLVDRDQSIRDYASNF